MDHWCAAAISTAPARGIRPCGSRAAPPGGSVTVAADRSATRPCPSGEQMRISDLARISGIPLPTIKFYIRERLLPPGRSTARNQAEYGEEHLTRLRLIRILTGIGRLSLSSVRNVLVAIDDKGLSLGGQCRATISALFPELPEEETNDIERARVPVDDFIDQLGWAVDSDSPGRNTLAHVLTALRRLDPNCDVDVFASHAEAAARVVANEFRGEPIRVVSTVVARTVLFEVAFEALRRMAQEHHLAYACAATSADPVSG